jgi:hypothetical protein
MATVTASTLTPLVYNYVVGDPLQEIHVDYFAFSEGVALCGP